MEQELKLLELSREKSVKDCYGIVTGDNDGNDKGLSFADRQELLGFLENLERLEQQQRKKPERPRFSVSPRVAIARMFRVYVMSRETDSRFQAAQGKSIREEYQLAARASRGLVGLQKQARRYLKRIRRRGVRERNVDPPPGGVQQNDGIGGEDRDDEKKVPLEATLPSMTPQTAAIDTVGGEQVVLGADRGLNYFRGILRDRGGSIYLMVPHVYTDNQRIARRPRPRLLPVKIPRCMQRVPIQKWGKYMRYFLRYLFIEGDKAENEMDGARLYYDGNATNLVGMYLQNLPLACLYANTDAIPPSTSTGATMEDVQLANAIYLLYGYCNALKHNHLVNTRIHFPPSVHPTIETIPFSIRLYELLEATNTAVFEKSKGLQRRNKSSNTQTGNPSRLKAMRSSLNIRVHDWLHQCSSDNARKKEANITGIGRPDSVESLRRIVEDIFLSNGSGNGSSENKQISPDTSRSVSISFVSLRDMSQDESTAKRGQFTVGIHLIESSGAGGNIDDESMKRLASRELVRRVLRQLVLCESYFFYRTGLYFGPLVSQIIQSGRTLEGAVAGPLMSNGLSRSSDLEDINKLLLEGTGKDSTRSQWIRRLKAARAKLLGLSGNREASDIPVLLNPAPHLIIKEEDQNEDGVLWYRQSLVRVLFELYPEAVIREPYGRSRTFCFGGNSGKKEYLVVYEMYYATLDPQSLFSVLRGEGKGEKVKDDEENIRVYRFIETVLNLLEYRLHPEADLHEISLTVSARPMTGTNRERLRSLEDLSEDFGVMGTDKAEDLRRVLDEWRALGADVNQLFYSFLSPYPGHTMRHGKPLLESVFSLYHNTLMRHSTILNYAEMGALCKAHGAYFGRLDRFDTFVVEFLVSWIFLVVGDRGFATRMFAQVCGLGLTPVSDHLCEKLFTRPSFKNTGETNYWDQVDLFYHNTAPSAARRLKVALAEARGSLQAFMLDVEGGERKNEASIPPQTIAAQFFGRMRDGLSEEPSRVKERNTESKDRPVRVALGEMDGVWNPERMNSPVRTASFLSKALQPNRTITGPVVIERMDRKLEAYIRKLIQDADTTTTVDGIEFFLQSVNRNTQWRVVVWDPTGWQSRLFQAAILSSGQLREYRYHGLKILRQLESYFSIHKMYGGGADEHNMRHLQQMREGKITDIKENERSEYSYSVYDFLYSNGTLFLPCQQQKHTDRNRFWSRRYVRAGPSIFRNG